MVFADSESRSQVARLPWVPVRHTAFGAKSLEGGYRSSPVTKSRQFFATGCDRLHVIDGQQDTARCAHSLRMAVPWIVSISVSLQECGTWPRFDECAEVNMLYCACNSLVRKRGPYLLYRPEFSAPAHSTLCSRVSTQTWLVVPTSITPRNGDNDFSRSMVNSMSYRLLTAGSPNSTRVTDIALRPSLSNAQVDSPTATAIALRSLLSVSRPHSTEPNTRGLLARDCWTRRRISSLALARFGLSLLRS